MRKEIFFAITFILIIFTSCNKQQHISSMKKFNAELLKPKIGKITSGFLEEANNDETACSIIVELKDFSFDDQKIATTISLDQVRLDFGNAIKLEDKTFHFSINPEPGYIDGSIYLFGVHNPFDVKKIEFGKVQNSTIETTIYYDILFEFEKTGYENVTDKKLTFLLTLKDDM